ncbi:hypothetical protein PM082_008924 [Marasmius tenuissimus]|nr:hypothetical protein PM082_008924 [Marasmius tenuissimus]
MILRYGLSTPGELHIAWGRDLRRVVEERNGDLDRREDADFCIPERSGRFRDWRLGHQELSKLKYLLLLLGIIPETCVDTSDRHGE